MPRILHYKIVAINQVYPDKPYIYLGSFQEQPKMHRVLTALITEFVGRPDADLYDLRSFSQGDVYEWEKELEGQPAAWAWNFSVGEVVYYVDIGLGPLEVGKPTIVRH